MSRHAADMDRVKCFIEGANGCLKVCHPERNEGSAVLEGEERNADSLVAALLEMTTPVKDRFLNLFFAGQPFLAVSNWSCP